MKKNGFTLAEVLITLAIIGVVATLTLPSLMTNTAEQQAITGYRKALNTLNEVGQMSAAVDGFDYSGISSQQVPGSGATVVNGIVQQSLWAMLANRAQVDASASGSANIGGSCSGNQIAFRDGTVLCYTDTATNGNINLAIHGFIDTNGRKGPNRLSTCGDVNCLPGNRSIGDQFPVTLHGGIAVPGNATFNGSEVTVAGNTSNWAAQWAMRK